ncbi:DNA primase [Frigidibacter sp. ROC022]|uniref:DNA primase n=1 Tax=Frigidibacter sp. ROC022 TaxID=2971796 RepID=UPI00215A41B4|nr:DNA primase [Frigidibacter sp. ROC022]MCR8725429.1 DNA primase [Frigidibacter sp. ROC022]
MSLPPGFLDELRNRTSLARVVGRKVSWDMRKSNQGKGDFWAPCPFHQEKSASFHVDDKKGFYYCFGCQAKGDAISFVRETENASFIEAIEILAREAGMTVPAADPRAQETADRRTRMAEVMELAVQHYRLQLKTAAAAQARDYLAGRGLGEAAQERFEIGFAHDSRQGLTAALKAKGVAPELILACGLAAEPEGGGAPYDRMRGRIIYPIRDARGRCIGFGGRSMDPNARAKYLNSPETELFDKGRSLYNLAPARAAAGKGKPLIVAEGYMDVIALVMAGFEAAVAPLGTAVTEEQLRLMWRISDEPVIALDGDAAGMRAALRVIDRALPLLEAGKGLRFAILPQGQDPDDLIRAGGPAAMQAVLDAAQPMVALLWQRETEGRNFDSPERKAALDRDLREALKKIADPSIRRHYGDEINRLRQALFRPAPPPGRSFPKPASVGGKGGRWRPNHVEPVLASTRMSTLAALPEGAEDRLREALVLAALLRHPDQIAEFEDRLARLDMMDPDHEALRVALLRHAHRAEGLREAVTGELGAEPLERLFADRHIRIAPVLRPDADQELVRNCLAEELAKLAARRAMIRELGDAVQDIDALPDEGLTWRLTQAAEARNRALRAEAEDRTVYDTGENGAPVSRDEKAAFELLLKQIAGTRERPPED